MIRRRWITWAFVVLLVVSIPIFAANFNWGATRHMLANASWGLLILAALVNIAAMAAKGWAFHLLLKPYAPHRFGSAQAATFVGAAVNCLSVSVGGEAARVHVLHQRDGVKYADAAAGILASRVVEAVALVFFVAIASLALTAHPWIVALRVVSWSVAIALVAGWYLGWLPKLASRLPAKVRPFVAAFSTDTNRPPLAMPIALGVFNWFAEWATYHFCIVAVGLTVWRSASLAALVAANIGGIPRLLPGNIGIIQGSIAVALAPFHVDVPTALLAGVALQAVTTLPILALGAAVAGTGMLKGLLQKGAVGR